MGKGGVDHSRRWRSFPPLTLRNWYSISAAFSGRHGEEATVKPVARSRKTAARAKRRAQIRPGCFRFSQKKAEDRKSSRFQHRADQEQQFKIIP